MASSRSKVDSALESFFHHDVAEGCRTLAALESQVPSDAQPSDDALLEEVTHVISRMLDACERIQAEIGEDDKLLTETKARFREAIWPWFQKSWFMHRATTKPRGYPGDFETLTAIYDGQVKSTGFGGYLDRYFLDRKLAQAVWGRLQSAKQFLCELTEQRPGLSILNVACGPGREYDDEFFRRCPAAEIIAVDTDGDALATTQARFKDIDNEAITVKCVKHSALKMTSVKKNLELFQRPDMIYSVGLCDYIPDAYLVKILRGWRESIADGGIVYVAFKDVREYRPAVYQWLVDWNFYERTEQECLDLMLQAGYASDDLKVTRDETNVILNFIAGCGATVPDASSQQRSDSWHGEQQPSSR
jgi:extracellular factor (EF) 3-hydroxypalmitic acid methyl ester biosynthesis protein